MTGLEGKLALVVAHPDDEILWFSSIAARAKKVIICFLDAPGQPDCTAGRLHAATSYPLPTAEFLGLSESMTFQGADWSSPVMSEFGLAVQRRPGTLNNFDADRYRDNYQRLVEALISRLEDMDAVITHNPWGEYGHEEHVQIYRAVRQVAQRLRLPLWYSNYCSDRSYALMLRSIDGRRSDYLTLPTDRALAHRIEAHYRTSGCWTWPFEDYRYFDHESFFLDVEPEQSAARGSSLPLNYIKIIDRHPASPEHPLRRAVRSTRRWLLRRTGPIGTARSR